MDARPILHRRRPAHLSSPDLPRHHTRSASEASRPRARSREPRLFERRWATHQLVLATPSARVPNRPFRTGNLLMPKMSDLGPVSILDAKIQNAFRYHGGRLAQERRQADGEPDHHGKLAGERIAQLEKERRMRLFR